MRGGGDGASRVVSWGFAAGAGAGAAAARLAKMGSRVEVRILGFVGWVCLGLGIRQVDR